jgi:hypothetical protein
MGEASVAQRVRHASMRIGGIAAVFAFAILGGGDLFDQWISRACQRNIHARHPAD